MINIVFIGNKHNSRIEIIKKIPPKLKKQIKFIAVENVFEVISEIFGGES